MKVFRYIVKYSTVRHFRHKSLTVLILVAAIVIFNKLVLYSRNSDVTLISYLQVFSQQSSISKVSLNSTEPVLNNKTTAQQTALDANHTRGVRTKFDSNHSRVVRTKFDSNHSRGVRIKFDSNHSRRVKVKFDSNHSRGVKVKFDSNHSVTLDADHFLSPFVLSEREPAVELANKNSNSYISTNRTWKFNEHRTRFVIRGNGQSYVQARTVAVIRPCDGRSGACLKARNITFKGCQHSQCLPTSNWQRADVLVIEPFYLPRTTVLPSYKRPASQRWVMFTVEAPCRYPQSYLLNTSQFEGQFNWSMTYNLDSDIPLLYGQLKMISPAPDIDYDGVYSSKTVLAAWFVSHCSTQSLRGPYVRQMQKVIEVDIFGRCGDRNCTFGSNYRYKDTSLCLPLLSSKYFFYLAFENSICKDYVTEKLFKLFPTAKVIPVVRGGTDYKKYFPPNTYIDSSDFDTPEDLAAHLKLLARDKYRYLGMLREKSKYESVQQEGWQCKLCEKMTTDHTVQWYPGNSMWTWFVQDKCTNPRNI